jgi:hypothetical protein
MTVPTLTVQVNGQGTVTADNYNTFEQTCDSVAELRNFVGISGMQVFMRGYSAPNDGGQGAFYWNATGTGPDDGGVTTIVPSGAGPVGVWTRILPNDVDIPISAAMTPVVDASTIAIARTLMGVVPANTILMVQPQGGSTTSSWIVYTPTGSILSTASSTTSGLQEALNYMQSTGYSCNLVVMGGTGVGTGPGLQYAQLICSTTVTFPPLRDVAILMYGVHIEFTSAVTGPGIIFDSMDNSIVDLSAGEIVYQGTGNAVVFDPRTAVPVDGLTYIGGSTVRLVCVVATGGTPQSLVQMNTSTASITNNHFYFGELNGGGSGTTSFSRSLKLLNHGFK